jgi:hypothetical protein
MTASGVRPGSYQGGGPARGGDDPEYATPFEPWRPEWTAALLEAWGDDAVWLGAWPDPSEPGVAHAVVAYPADRVAGLQHFREELDAEIDCDGTTLDVVIYDVGAIGRLWLRGHGRLLGVAHGVPLDDPRGRLSMVQAVAGALWTPDADAWLARWGGEPVEPGTTRWNAAARFSWLDAWVRTSRG